MAIPKLDPRLRARNVVSHPIAAIGSALILFAIGCRGPAVDDGDNIELQSSAVANPTTPVTKAATVKPPTTGAGKKAATPTVWVVMKSQANAAAAGKGKDWKSKGQAVVNALTSNATSSQASLKAFLGSRA